MSDGTTTVDPETSAATGDGELRRLEDITPSVIFEELQKGVLGQDQALSFVSVALYKHTTGRVSGNVL